MAEKKAKSTKTTKTTKTTTKKTTAKKPVAKAAAKTTAPKVVKEVKKTEAVKAEAPKKKGKGGVIVGAIIALIVIVGAAALAMWICLQMSITRLVGNYNLTGLYANGEDQSANLQFMESTFGATATMELRDDGTGTMELFGEPVNFTYDKDKLVINDQENPFTYKDGAITFESDGTTLTFTKQ